MDYHLVELSQLSEDEIKRLSVLHHSVMQTLLSELGLPLVRRYYQIAQEDREVIGLCASSASREVLGWAIGSPHPDRINARLRSPLSWFFVQMLRVVFTRPWVLMQLVSSLRSASGEVDGLREAIELTYIGVAAAQRGEGVGKRLLDAFIETSRSRGYHSVVLSVERENSPAISLYEKAGFRIIKTFTEGRYQRHRMELALLA